MSFFFFILQCKSWFSGLEKFTFETYLSCVSYIKHSNSLSWFRCSVHKLAIEEGRHIQIPKVNRLCKSCNMQQVNTIFTVMSFLHWFKKNVVYKDITGYGHQYKQIVQSQIFLRNLAAFIVKTLKSRGCSL